jgi:hypothetical protein
VPRRAGSSGRNVGDYYHHGRWFVKYVLFGIVLAAGLGLALWLVYGAGVAWGKSRGRRDLERSLGLPEKAGAQLRGAETIFQDLLRLDSIESDDLITPATQNRIREWLDQLDRNRGTK